MRVNINVARCVEYLQGVGIELPANALTEWQTQEQSHRAFKRAHRRELKTSCGHFNTSWCKITHQGGVTNAKACSDCGRYIEYQGASL